MNAVALDRLSFSYPGSEAPAVVDVTLTVVKGTCHGLLGPNGAGKTTLIHLLCGLLTPSSGRGEVLGARLGSIPARMSMGLCPQSLALYPTLTARENLKLFGALAGLRGAGRAARIAAVLEETGLADHADRRVETYSGGMKRRMNLAVAMLHAPPILLLDEPTTGVDPQSRNLIFESLTRLRRAGTTLLYTTHYMEEAERLCETISIVDHGKILVTEDVEGLTRGAQGGRVTREERFLELTGRQLRD